MICYLSLTNLSPLRQYLAAHGLTAPLVLYTSLLMGLCAPDRWDFPLSVEGDLTRVCALAQLSCDLMKFSTNISIERHARR